jgi:60 kDa SS-A/Ro ribonucleoprotein
MTDALDTIRTRTPRQARTPQRMQADERQVLNNAGGYAFQVTGEERIRRFLTLGTESTYYVKTPELTKDNAGVVIDWAQNRGTDLVRIVTEISVAGRAPRQNPALFALAAAVSFGDDEAKAAVVDAITDVVRTGTHLTLFVKYATNMRGWGRALRRAVQRWYLAQDVDKLAYQVVKYRNRNGWSHLDLIREAHPVGGEGARNDLFGWLAGKKDTPDIAIVQSYLAAKAADALPLEKATKEWVRLVQGSGSLPWEALPDRAVTRPEVWQALIDNGMPQTALIRQLPKLTNLGLLAPMSANLATVTAQLSDTERLRKGRVHPVTLLIALKTYAAGHSLTGDTRWTPVQKVIDALDSGFYNAFPNITPANKRTMLATDTSGSMGWEISGMPLKAVEAVSAMALVTAASEPHSALYGFSTGLKELPVSPRMRLDQVCQVILGHWGGGTDCSLPMQWAQRNKIEVDTFQVYTDNETWYGDVHPHEALENYRQASGIPARLAVIAAAPTQFTIADPADPGSMDVSGFDSNVPALLADFSRGDL